MPAVFINDESFEHYLNLIHVKAEREDPCRADLGAIVRFLSDDGTKGGYSDVFNVLATLKDEKKGKKDKKDLPVFVLDRQFRPDHSKSIWLESDVVGYLPQDQGDWIWKEIQTYFSERRERFESYEKLKATDFYNLGWSVRITPEDHQTYNFVSLFIGHMRKFIVDLKLFLDMVRPPKLEANPIKNEQNLSLLMELKWAKDAGRYPLECSIDGQSYSKEDIADKLKATSAEMIFREGKPAFTQGHVLIQGETGTGKSIMADFVHEYLYKPLSMEKKFRDAVGELRKVTCTNIGEKILENELFGSVKGYFTDGITQPGLIITAYNGTVFLDEIGDLDLSAQAKLLQYLDNRTIRPTGWLGPPIYVPAIIVAATNKDLRQAVENRTFRLDLLHRFGLTITIPPLRKRKDDLERLVDFVLQNPRINPLRGKRHFVEKIEKAAVEQLKKYDFPGNFRELEQILREATIMATSHGLPAITAGIMSDMLSKTPTGAPD